MTKFRKFMTKLFVDDCNCILCGCELIVKDGSGLCDECHAKLEYVGEKYCLKCGCVIYNEAQLCLECQNNVRHFDRARAMLVYTGALHKIILNYKFYNKKYLSKYLARFICGAYKKYFFDCDIIVPMPISKERYKERKYNQAELLAEECGDLKLPIISTALVKHKDTPRQTELNGIDRRKNVLGAYSVVDSAAVKGKRVLLLDDVLTTGTSVNEAARVLKIAGALKVEVITIAIAHYRLPMEEAII